MSGSEWPRNVADAEIAFARDAQIRTVDEAFRSAFATDAIMFRPLPVNAHESLRARPIAADVRLVWTPATAETAAAGDLAVTSGPAHRGKRGSAPTAGGSFLSVWRWNGKRWQVVFDAGTEGPFSNSIEPGIGSINTRMLRPAGTRSDDIEQMKGDIMHTERTLIEDYAENLREHAASDIRFFRNGRAPTATVAEAISAAEGDDDVVWTPQAAFVSRSGDLGYVYGVSRLGTEEKGYIRVYRNQDASWRVAYDLR